MDKSKDVFLISKEEDFDLICSPVRASVLEILIAFGPMPIRGIAEKLGRSATLIHHHVGILFRGGLLYEHAREKRGKHIERVFAVTTQDWRYDFETHPEVMAAGMLRIAKTWGRHAERLLTKALKKNRRFMVPMRRFISIRAETGQLSEQAADNVREHLLAIRRIFEQERKRGSTGDPFHVFWNYFPMAQEPSKEQKGKPTKAEAKPKAGRPKSRPKGVRSNQKTSAKSSRKG